MIRKTALLLAFALGLAAIVVAFLVFRPDRSAPPVDCPAGTPGCPAELSEMAAEDALVQRYAPIVQLRHQSAPCDRGGAGFDPLPVEIVLENPEVVLRRAGDAGFEIWAPSTADLFRGDGSLYLDFPGNPHRPGCRYELDGRRFGEDEPHVAYGRIVREDGFAGKLALQYWFFYYFNDWNNKHEGDWEMIQLVFEAETARQALREGPAYLAYSQHSGGEIADWSDKKLEKVGDRPVVYVAVGSQANFYSPHVFIGRGEGGAGFGCDDASKPGRRLSLEVRRLPAVVIGADDPYAWLTFEGRWGELAGPEFDGPTGPNMKLQWSEPLTWAETLRYSSVRAPSRDFFGPNAVDAFCSVIGWGSDLFLPLIIELPLISAGAGVALALGLLLSLTRTRYLPVQSRPLRTHRRFGQILLSAVEIYRRRLRLYLGIGLVFAPVGVIWSLLHWLVLGLSPVEPVVPVPAATPGLEVLMLFLLGELQFGVVYFVVLAASTATLPAVEAGVSVSVRSAYREVMTRLPHLFLPRIMAIVAVLALAASIVGLPLAVRQAVRWIFVEQAVLLDGAGGLGALRRSGATVARDWWWASAAVLALLALGLFFAPLVGIVVILLLRSVPLIYADLLSSLLFMALVPYVAIALSLVYLDLRSRPEDEA